ncbi:MAG: hypothetical protein Kow00129_02510 [Thermoleophilia bacterium]
MSGKSDFFEAQRFALIGGGKGRSFPKLTRRYLEQAGKEVHVVDLSADGGSGSLAELLDGIPSDTEAVIVEVPKEQTAGVVQGILDQGFDNLWIHQMTDTEEAVEVCRARGVNPHTGSCAVMYLAPGLSPHALHRAVWKLIGRY